MNYDNLIKAFNIRCPDCDGDLSIASATQVSEGRIEYSPLLECQNKEICGSTYRPTISLERSIENIEVTVNVDISKE